MNRVTTEEELELDRVVREGLCTRPASGPNAQSIDDAARDIIVADAIHTSTPAEFRPHRGEETLRKIRASLEIVRPDLDPWERMRSAARILRGDP